MKGRIKKRLLRIRAVKKTHRWLHSITLPGFGGVRFMPVFKFFLRGVVSEDINVRSGAIAFNFFMALFPAAIFFFTMIAYLPIKNLQQDVLDFLSTAMPYNAYEAIKDTLVDILKNRKGGLLSLGFFLALYFSANGVSSVITAFNSYTHSVESRGFWRHRLTSVGLTLYISLLLVITLVISTVGTLVLEWLKRKGILTDGISLFGLHALKWLISIFFLYMVISSLYYFGPAKKRRWAFFNPGSTLAAFLSFATTYGFTTYVNHFNSYNKLYGSIGTLIVIMLLIFFNAMVLLIGFELNVSIDRALSEKIEADHINLKELEKAIGNTFKSGSRHAQ